jgi:hypothetical protein
VTSGDPTATIRSRGYWRVVVRPTRFQEDRVSGLAELEESARSCIVEIRGWDYPHWPREGTRRMGEFIEGRVDWEDHKELWRLYRTSQFVHLFAMREDWLGENQGIRRLDITPGSVLSYDSTIFSFTEIFLFAARLGGRFNLGPKIRIEIDLEGLANRRLYTFDVNRVPFGDYRRADVERFRYEEEYEPATLIADARKLALTPLQRLFELFNWDTTPESLEPAQARLLENR